jgi:hypothetical protein
VLPSGLRPTGGAYCIGQRREAISDVKSFEGACQVTLRSGYKRSGSSALIAHSPEGDAEHGRADLGLTWLVGACGPPQRLMDVTAAARCR